MNGTEDPGAGALLLRPGPMSPPPSPGLSTLAPRRPLLHSRTWPTHSGLARQTNPFVPNNVGGRGGCCFCAVAAPQRLPSEGEAQRGRQSSPPPQGKRVPALKWEVSGSGQVKDDAGVETARVGGGIGDLNFGSYVQPWLQTTHRPSVTRWQA